MGIQKTVEPGLLSAVAQLPKLRAEEAVDVLADSFYEYPVMRHIIGAAGDSYGGRLYKLMRFFVAARFSREEPVLAVSENESALGVAILTPPVQRDAPSTLAEHRESLWKELGKRARSRYEGLGDIWQQFTVPDPHYHLNMIGVLNAHSGRGLGRRLLDAVHDMSLAEPGSSGVSLTTEDANNVPLYEHFGYEVIGHEKVTPELETWGMFRPDSHGW